MLNTTVRRNLFKHQIDCVINMEKFEKHQEIPHPTDPSKVVIMDLGIIGDKVGAGKTTSCVVTMDRDEMYFNKDTPTSLTTLTYMNPLKRAYVANYSTIPKIDCNLVLCTDSIGHQWVEDCSRSDLHAVQVMDEVFVSNLRLINGYLVHNDRPQVPINVLIVSSNMFYLVHDKFYNFWWKRLFVDEADTMLLPLKLINGKEQIPNVDSYRYTPYAEHRWFISATYKKITDNFSKNALAKETFARLKDEIIPIILIKTPDEDIDLAIKLPPPIVVNHQCRRMGGYNQARDVHDVNIQNQLDAGNIAGAIASIGGSQYKGAQSLIHVTTWKLKRELAVAESMLEIYTKQQELSMMERTYIQIKQIKGKIDNILERFKNSLINDDCGICIEKFTNPVLIPCCQNLLCFTCIMTHLNSGNGNHRCPFCREYVDARNLIAIDPNGDIEDAQKIGDNVGALPNPMVDNNNMSLDSRRIVRVTQPITDKNKYQITMEILKNSDKTLTVSSSNDTRQVIQNMCVDAGIEMIVLEGTPNQRQNALEKFKTTPNTTLFIQAAESGAGLNLQFVNDIILFNDIPENVKIQVRGRADRLGRNVNVPLIIHELIENEN